MSKSFGYADDFKIISQNAVTLQIDGHRLWKWCSENQMSLNLKKCNVVAFKGTASVALGGHILDTAAVQNDLGIQVSESLSWACHVEKRTTKALKCFYMIKRSTLNTTAWQTKKAIYRSYIVPIVSYGAILFKASKTDLRIIENVQKRAVKWIFNRKDNDYKTSLQILNLLPLSFYHELHVLLTFISIVKNKIDVEWRNYVSVGEQQITRAGQISINAKFTSCKSKKVTSGIGLPTSQIYSAGISQEMCAKHRISRGSFLMFTHCTSIKNMTSTMSALDGFSATARTAETLTN